MGLGTLSNRAAGQTILDTFFNDIHGCLNGDFVGRNASGVATAGQNLGTAALPWGTGRFDSLIVGGSAFDVSQVTSPQNRVVSGKVRTTSNQPAFLTPSGSTAEVTLFGSATNLVLDILGAAVTVSTDITVSGMTTAPASNNTALVNDTDAADQTDTRIWGTPGHKKSITIGTVGSNITALVGKHASFALNNGSATEYFYAKVESSTSLSEIRRGYFYDSSLNPVNRVAFANNDTITLLSTAHIFVENNATTVTASYTEPTYSAVQPTSPATNDYWYDMVNLVWKRYDGASFQIVNRTLVGMAILTSSACVGARCEPFFKQHSPYNTLLLEVQDTSVVRAAYIGQRVVVNGALIDFGKSRPTWNITTQLVATPDSYSGSEASSTYYYVYVTDEGEVKISDIEPIYFPEFYGEYHPHNPWRCVGDFFNDASSNVVRCGSDSNGYETRFFARTWSAVGAVDTTIVRFSSFTILGTGVHLQDTANNGTIGVIRKRGTYSMHANHNSPSNTAEGIALTKNETQLTTPVSALTFDDTILNAAWGNVIAGSRSTLFSTSWEGNCNIGDLIRAHTDGATPNTATWSRFTISKSGIGRVY